MRARLCHLALVACLVPLVATAQEDRRAELHTLYAKSGLEKQVEQIPLLVGEGFEQAATEGAGPKEMPTDVAARIRRAIPEAFAPERIKGTLLAKLEERLSTDDVRSVLRWLDSPIGRRCTRLEEAAGTPEGYAELQKFADGWQGSPPPRERMALLEELDGAIGATEATVAIAMNTQAAIMVSFLATLPTEQQVPLARILDQVERARPAVEAMVGQQVLLGFLYTYQSLSAAELQSYLDFARSPAGANYHAASIAGMRAALLESAVKLGEAVKTAGEDGKKQFEL